MKQDLLTISEHLSRLSSPPVVSGVHVARSLVIYVMFCRSSCVLLRIKESDYPFGIFKLFLTEYCKASCHDILLCLKSNILYFYYANFYRATYIFYVNICSSFRVFVLFGHCIVCPSIYVALVIFEIYSGCE